MNASCSKPEGASKAQGGDSPVPRSVEQTAEQRTGQVQALLNAAPLGVYLIDDDFRIREVNPVAQTVFGNIPNLIGRDFEEVLHILWPKDYAAEFVQRFRRTLETGESFSMTEMIQKRLDRGDIEYYEWQINRIPLPDGRLGVVCYFRDISERKRAEAALRESELRYRSLFESIDEGFCVIEMIFDEKQKPLDYKFIEVNPAFERQAGMHGATGKRMLEFVSYIEPHWLENYGRVALTGEPIRFAEEYKSLGRWFDVYAFRVGAPQSRRVAVIFNNVTQQKISENALRESEKRFRAFVTTSSDLIYRMNADWTEMRQFQGEDFTADTERPYREWIQKYIHPNDHAKVMAAIREAIRTKSPLQLEHRVLRADGSLGWTFSRAIPLLGAHGEILEWFGAATDVTDRKRAEEKLEQAVQERTAELRELVGELEAVSYSIAHDMRAPLRAMQNFSSILIEEYSNKLDADGVGYLARIQSAAARQDALIQDALIYSRVLREEMPMASIDLNELVNEIIETYPHLQPPHAEIEIQGNLPRVLGNTAGLTQCISNLLGNAVKFVEPGVLPKIKVRAEKKDHHVLVWIEDNGIGIEPKDQERIFRMFERVPPSKSYEGTGIGLAIVRKAAERMGGKVGVQSTPGKGSQFWIQLQSG